jgi:hypothetical protein
MAIQRTLWPTYLCGIRLEDNVDQNRIKFTYDWTGAAISLLAGGATNPLEVGNISRLGTGYK